MQWFVYMILCSDESLYTGITKDIDRRFREHSEGRLGAKYFRGRQASRLVYLEGGHDRSSATKREIAIKRLNRAHKLLLLRSDVNQLTH
ncbi:GIY-YIG nuclease family protein [Methylotuvimicrobium sp. KM1]|uniref:GIY-YIG nuclease family protein n=1 Tax=Methylotuvimicrobium sp. KM1 TaxID=3377707 RepID=UPI00384C7AC7